MTTFEPKQFGKYFLLEKLAVGGMAEIYKAKTFGVDGFEKLLVLKRILPHCVADKDFISMLTDEAKLSVMLSHANIVQVYDLGKVGEDYFISMEYINGINLRDIMYRCREHNIKIPSEISAYMISEICKGLDYAHRKTDSSGHPLNIVHRDISPQNILISYEGEVKIVDFGIAKAAMNISHTMAGILKGKIAYMSPEQALGKTTDCRTDIFSTGIILYETLTGEKLYTGESQFEVLKKIRTTRLDAAQLPDGIPDGLRGVLAKALAYFPKDRYQSAGDMQAELTRHLYSTYVDFTPQKIATFIKELFNDEILREREKNILESAMAAQTASINLAEEAMQENLVHREDTESTGHAAITHSGVTAPAIKRDREKPGRMGLGKRLAVVTGILMLFAGLGLAYFKFVRPKHAEQAPILATGALSITSDPSAAKIFLDGKDTALITPAVIDGLPLNKSYTVRLTKDEYANEEKDVALLSAEPVSLDFSLAIADGTLEVVTTPPGAEVLVDGLSTGEITPTKLKNLALKTDIKVSVVKSGFKNFEQVVKLTSPKPQTLTIKLMPAAAEKGSIQISSNPAGAQVFLNGRDTGLVTPTTLTDVTIGEPQNLRLVKQGFSGEAKTITLKDTTSEVVAIELSPASGAAAEVNVSSAKVSSKPTGAKVFLDGRDTGLTTPTELKELTIGKSYNIELEKANFTPWTREIKIATAEPVNIKGVLSPTPVAPPPATKPQEPANAPSTPPPPINAAPTAGSEPATIKISSEPNGAEVFINAEYKGTTPTTITNIIPGTVSVLLNKEGKARFSQKISIKPGETKDLGQVKLGSLYGIVTITTSPPRADVIFDGEDIGAKTPLTIKKVRRDKQHSIKLVLDGYKPWERTFDMEGEQEERKFNIIMEK